MTENASAPADPSDQLPAPAEPPPQPTGRNMFGLLVAVGFVITAAGGAWLYEQHQDIVARIQPAPPPFDTGRLSALESRLDTVQQRLAQLEQRPLPAPAAAGAPAPDLKPLEARLDQVSAKVAALQGADAGAAQALTAKLQAFEQRLAEAEQRQQAVNAGAARTARLQAATVALEAGRPLGDIPGAPPAVARFGTASPPTLASLRLAFPDAAAAAEQASRPSTTGLSLADRLWQRAQSLVTVQQGNKVLIGPPSVRVLAQARALLDAGDLAGAVAALGPLDPPAAAAMAEWRAQAQSLLDARAALASMARS